MLIQGIQLAAAARSEAAQWDADYDQLLASVEQLENEAKHELLKLRNEAQRDDTIFATQILPLLEGLGVLTGEVD